MDLNIINLHVELDEIHRYNTKDDFSCGRRKFIAIAIEHNTIHI